MTPRRCLALCAAFSSLAALTLPHANADEPRKKATPPPLFNLDLSGGDLQFLNSAAEQGLLQADLAALAASHAKSSEIKDYARGLAAQHAAQNERIKLLAVKKGLTIPTGLNEKQKAASGKLAQQQGLKFDKAYLEEVIQDEQSYETLFEQASRSSDPDIKAFANSSLPDIKEKLSLVRSLAGIAPRSSAGAPVQFRSSAAPAPTGK